MGSKKPTGPGESGPHSRLQQACRLHEERTLARLHALRRTLSILVSGFHGGVVKRTGRAHRRQWSIIGWGDSKRSIHSFAAGAALGLIPKCTSGSCSRVELAALSIPTPHDWKRVTAVKYLDPHADKYYTSL
jgi:hypothetical protein